jgi:hypothetical protein
MFIRQSLSVISFSNKKKNFVRYLMLTEIAALEVYFEIIKPVVEDTITFLICQSSYL